MIRLFTAVQPKEGIYISPKAHKSWPVVPALRLLQCLFGLRLEYGVRQTLSNVISDYTDYKHCKTNGSCSWSFQSGELENIFCSFAAQIAFPEYNSFWSTAVPT